MAWRAWADSSGSQGRDPGAGAHEHPAHAVGQGAHTAGLADDDVTVAQGTGGLAQALALPDLGHHLLAFPPGADTRQGLEGFPPADAVDGETGVALKVAQGLVSERAEDRVDSPRVEAEAAEHALQGGHVVAAQHAVAVVEEPVTKTAARFDQRVPGLGAADAVDPQPPMILEGTDAGVGRLAVPAELIGGGVEPEGAQPLLQVPDRFEAAARA